MTTALHLGGAEGTRLLLPVVPHEPSARAPTSFRSTTEVDKLPGFESLDLGTPSGYGEISSVDRNPQRHRRRVTATNASAVTLSVGRGAQHGDDHSRG